MCDRIISFCAICSVFAVCNRYRRSRYVSSVKGAVRCKERQKYCLTFLVAVHNWVLLKNKTMEDKNNKIIIVIKHFKSYKLK